MAGKPITLEGFETPVKSRLLEDLTFEFRRSKVDVVDLEAIGAYNPGLQDIHRPQTSDGYLWWWSLDYGEFQVLFPWQEDLERKVQVYAKNGTRKGHVKLFERCFLPTLIHYFKLKKEMEWFDERKEYILAGNTMLNK